jgi:tetratricopeptide (TPR) repeat protein
VNRRNRRTAAKCKSALGGPRDLAALCVAGLNHLRAERLLDAQLCCQQALAIDSNYPDALHLMGLLSIQAQQYDHAAEWVARAVRQDSRLDYLVTLGTILQFQKRFAQAFEAFDKAAQVRPDAARLWSSRGKLLVELKRPGEALLSFQRALELNPRDCEAAFNCGLLLHDEGRLQEAVLHFTLCDELKPNHAPILRSRGRALGSLGQFNEALADNIRAHELDPTDAANCSNIAGLLQSLHRDEEVPPWLDKALSLQPDQVDALRNKAVWLRDHHRFDEAFAIYQRLKVLDPGNARTEWNLSHLHLLTGDLEAGWAARESRWKVPGLTLARFEPSQPIWLGQESIDGKTVVIHFDEGLGDTIQFARYVPLVAARGARVILVAPAALCSLLSALPGVSECLPTSNGKLPAFDMYCPISSLPLAFGTRLETIPSAISYLPSSAQTRVQAWEDRLGSHDRLRVGLVWSGNPEHKNDRNRSLPLRELSPLLDLEATFVSLQKELRPDDRTTLLQNAEIVDLTGHLTDFVETAALISCLDLVITVDTSVAHLSGALGCPTWILLPYTPDYRWLLDRDDSPWYPTVRLFRQTEARLYTQVLERVRAALSARIAGFARSPARSA